ncbi:MAG: PP2C family protein-serine/threonine phosphatase, partial [Planctomycetota bacterium]
YVDTMALPDGNTALLMGDVAGHGLGAAAFVFTARALLRSGLAEGRDPRDVVTRANRFLCRDMAEGRFMTLFLGVHDPEKGELSFLNAGHTPPLVVEPGSLRELERTSVPLGVLDSARYDKLVTVPLSAGATFFAYTDGVVEARNPEGDLFGKERLLSLLRVCLNDSPQELLGKARAAILDFVADEVASDDLTLLAYRPLSPGTETQRESSDRAEAASTRTAARGPA